MPVPPRVAAPMRLPSLAGPRSGPHGARAETISSSTSLQTATDHTATAKAAAAVVEYCTVLAPHPLGQDDAEAR